MSTLAALHRMKLMVRTLLAAAMCMEIGQALLCYTCDTPKLMPECNQLTNCTALSPLLRFCKTTVFARSVGFPIQGSQTVIRQCAQVCDGTNPNLLGVTDPIYCCNTDLCNNNMVPKSNGETESSAATNLSYVTATISALCIVSMLLTGL